MKVRASWRSAIIIVVSGLLWRTVAHAQTDSEVNSGIQFNFSTPGARSLALGGAFLGLADDATAAYTNPAGLTTLSKAEISIEGRRWDFTNQFTDRGYALGAPTGDPTSDNIHGLVTGQSNSSTNGLSYLSIVYPHQRWALALYRHEVANFDALLKTQGPYFGDGSQGKPDRLYPVIAGMDLKIVNLGFSGAFQVSDKLSLGLGVSSYNFNLSSTTNRFAVDLFGVPSFQSGDIINVQEQRGDDQSTGLNFGFRWRPTSQLSIGGVYRQGPEFDLETKNSFGPAFTGHDGEIITQNKGKFRVPNVYGLGLSFRPWDALTVNFDYDRIGYSRLTKSSFDIYYPLTDVTPDAVNYRLAVRRLVIDDANELHLGFEYVLLRFGFPLSLRVGSWYDPDHKIHFKGDPGSDAASQVLAVLFRPGDNEIHYSAGLGFVFREKFQLDVAYDHSHLIDTASLSAVFRF